MLLLLCDILCGRQAARQAAMFPQFTNTAASLTRATALIHRVGTDAYLYDDPEDANIASLLDSKFEAEKVQGLKRLIALLSQGVDVSNFFPQVCLSASPEFLLVHSFKIFSGSESSLLRFVVHPIRDFKECAYVSAISHSQSHAFFACCKRSLVALECDQPSFSASLLLQNLLPFVACCI